MPFVRRRKVGLVDAILYASVTDSKVVICKIGKVLNRACDLVQLRVCYLRTFGFFFLGVCRDTHCISTGRAKVQMCFNPYPANVENMVSS